jgi:glycosyltransferase involved in cell wall biosynthesis
MNPLVSVITPAYNAENFIAQTIESILAQNHRNLELLIVDDGSTDATFAICQRYAARERRVKLLRHPDGKNKGPSRSREYALKHSKGEYIAFCDADDTMRPDKIETQLAAFDKHPEVILVHTGVEVTAEDKSAADFLSHWFNRWSEEKIYNFLKTDFLRQDHICNSSTMVKAGYLKKIHFSFQQTFQHEDWLMLILLAQHGPFAYLPQPLTKYFYSSHSATFKLMNNPFIVEYSKIEMYLILLARLPWPRFILRANVLWHIAWSLGVLFLLQTKNLLRTLRHAPAL